MLPKQKQAVKIMEYENHDRDEQLYINALELYRFFNS